ncbi:MAG: radical SAM protein, partial [Promethearchaeota archaeon]
LFNNKKLNDFTFNSKGEIIKININKNEFKNIIEENSAFVTPGCPGCNRPYYTSKPSGPIYNFPRNLVEKEKLEIYNMLKEFVN